MIEAEPVGLGAGRGRRAATEPIRILFVCLGNICRSPTAAAVMEKLIAEAEMAASVELDSAGTGAWHVGEPPDARASAAALERGITLSGLARQIRPADFSDFDLILAMDRSNLAELRLMTPEPPVRARLGMLREFDPASVLRSDLDVPDPYYGGPGGFDQVLDVVQAGCLGVLEELRARSDRARNPEERGSA